MELKRWPQQQPALSATKLSGCHFCEMCLVAVAVASADAATATATATAAPLVVVAATRLPFLISSAIYCYL